MHRAPAPGPPQESLVRDETRTSLPAKPSLTRTTLGQLCVAPRTSQSRPAVTEPGQVPRVSGGSAGAAMQFPRRLRHLGGIQRFFFLSNHHKTCVTEIKCSRQTLKWESREREYTYTHTRTEEWNEPECSPLPVFSSKFS